MLRNSYLLFTKTKGYTIYYPHLYTLFPKKILIVPYKDLFSETTIRMSKTTEQRSIGTKIKFF